MNPRLKSSKKWTAFPKEYSEQIQTVFSDNFASYLVDASLVVEGRIYPEEVLLRVGYLEKGRLTQANFEVSMNYSQIEQDAVARIHNCIDAAASMMVEYFEKEGVVDFPYTWTEFPFQGKKMFLQYNTENSTLESEANRLLGVNEDDLLLEVEEGEDALEHAELDEELSPPRDDEEDFPADLEDEDPSPKMFGGKKKKKKDDLH